MCQTTCQASRQNMSQDKCRDACPNECQSALRINVRISNLWHHITIDVIGAWFFLQVGYSHCWLHMAPFFNFLVVVTTLKFNEMNTLQWDVEMNRLWSNATDPSSLTFQTTHEIYQYHPHLSLHCRQIFHVATLQWVKLTLVAASVQSEVSKTGGGTSFSQKRTERKPTGNFYNYEHNQRPAVEAKAPYKFSTKAQKLIGAKAHPSTKKCIVHFGAFRPYQLRLLVAADWPLQPAECHWGGH